MRTRLTPFALVFVLLAGLTAAGGVVSPVLDRSPKGTEELDVRAGLPGIPPTEAMVGAIVALVREHPDVRLRWNARFGTPSAIQRYGAALAAARAGSPVDAAKAWLRDHAAIFGWGYADVAAMTVEKTLAQPAGGAHTVLFHQVFGGLHGGSFGGSLVVALDDANRVLSVRANVAPGTKLAGAARVGASRALEIASDSKGLASVGRRGEWSEFARGRFAANHFVRPVAFPTGEGARRAWEVLFVKRLWEGYRTVVDAGTGEVLYRHQMASFEAPEGRVFDNYPGAKAGGAHELRSFAGDPQASPEGWLSLLPGVDNPTTLGNNASTATNWAIFLVPDGPGQVRPVAPDYVFDYEFTDAWRTSECGANPISELENPDSGQPLHAPDTPTYALDALPAVTNLFYHHNVMHDFFYKLGFTEEAGALQFSNFGKTGSDLERDPLLGLVQAGAVATDAPTYFGRDNAYMFPFPDGLPSWSGMFVWEPIPGAINVPCVDGDFDAQVIYHEYSHGVTSRWVGGEFGNIDSFHGGSMGEAWSDFFAMHYLHEKRFETSNALGTYVTSNVERGIRNFALDKVTATFADIGYDVDGEEVHSDGEIWAGVLWDLREALKKARPSGASLAAQLVADAMPISGPVPSMLDMRDAILQADLARTKGANQDLIWTVFARKGMGFSAMAKDAFDVDPIPAFDHKDAARNGRITGRMVDRVTGKGISGARVIIGHFEARVSPVVKTAADGSFTFPIQAGRYRFAVQAPGYGTQAVALTIAPGQSITRRVPLSLNYAAAAAGAKVVSSSNPSTLGAADLAIDDTANTAWVTDDDDDGPAGESFVVDLAGTQPVEIVAVQVDAMKSPVGSRYDTLKRWTVFGSMDGKTFSPIGKTSVPADIMRPKVPDLRIRAIRASAPARARFLKFVADETQYSAGTRVQVAEVQVFGRGEALTVKAVEQTADEAFHDEGLILVTSTGLLTTTVMEAMGEAGQCIFPPPTQGIDAWVSQLPDGFGDGHHLVDVKLESLVPDPRPDLDVFFFSAGCKPTGSIATGAPRELGTIRQGSKYVVGALFTTVGGSVTVDAKGAFTGLVAKVPKPRVLANTGVASALPFGLGLLGAALGGVGWLRRGDVSRRRRRASGRTA